MKVRFEADPQHVLDFMRAQEYPCPWDIESLRQCALFRIESEDGYIAAFVWVHYQGNTMRLQFHACANRCYRGRWLTRPVFDRLLVAAELMSASALTTVTEGPLQPLISRLLSRLGFEPDGEAMTYFMETPHGPVLEAEDQRPGAVAAAEPAARSS